MYIYQPDTEKEFKETLKRLCGLGNPDQKNMFSTDNYGLIFENIKTQIFNDYCFINGISTDDLSNIELPKEVLERIHYRAIEIFKSEYPQVSLSKDILNYKVITQEEKEKILDDITDNKKFKNSYFDVEEDYMILKLLEVDPKYHIDQTDYFIVVVSELYTKNQKRILQLAYDIETGVCVGTPEMAHRLYFEKGIIRAYLLNANRKVANLGMHEDGTWSGWVNSTFRHFGLGDQITENSSKVITNLQQSKIEAINFVTEKLSNQKNNIKTNTF